MQSTVLGLSFEVLDRDVNYVVVGTSDNYSFEYDLGRGDTLTLNNKVDLDLLMEGEQYRIHSLGTTDFTLVGAVNNVVGEVFTANGNVRDVDLTGGGELMSVSNRYSTAIDLKGNYGRFSVRVYAENDIGIRSEFIQDIVDINPPMFDKTFLFSDIYLKDSGNKIKNKILKEASQASRSLSVESSFLNKEIDLYWELAPPPGHAQEGQSLSSELLYDDFFSHFEISIYKYEEKINSFVELSKKVIDDSSLSSRIGTESAFESLQEYRGFSLNLGDVEFLTLLLTRLIKIKVTCVDKFGRKSYGEILCRNSLPHVSNFSFSRDGFKFNFDWNCVDEDYYQSEVEILAIPINVGLVHPTNISMNANHFAKLKSANNFRYIKGVKYKKGVYIKYKDNNVYLCLQDITLGVDENGDEYDNSPENDFYWQNMGPIVDYLYSVKKERFSVSVNQVWNYNYFYSFTAHDGFGAGPKYIFVGRGIELMSSAENLVAINCEIKINNLRFSEINGDDLLFSWDIVDDMGQTVDLEKYKNLPIQEGLPSTIGISGSLFDLNSKDRISYITEGNSSSSYYEDKGGSISKIDGLPSAKIFDSYLYTREYNNFLYGTGGFPDNTKVFDPSRSSDEYIGYKQGEYVANFEQKKVFKALLDSFLDGVNLPPQFRGWGAELEVKKDACILYEQQAFKCIKDFNLKTEPFNGIFDSTKNYLPGEYVIVPDGIKSFQQHLSYSVGDLVLHEGQVYICSIRQIPGLALSPKLYPNHWQDVTYADKFTYKLHKCLYDSAPTISLPQNNTNWEYQTPIALSEYFYKVIDPYDISDIKEWSPAQVFYEGSFVVYQNDIWICLQDNGLGFEAGIQKPSQGGSFWSNSINGQDIYSAYAEGDLVISDGMVYKCLRDNPTGAPILAITNPGKNTYSSYEESGWMPIWERDTNHMSQTYVFGHVGIPQKGSRGVGLEVGILSNTGRVVESKKIEAYNPPPDIIPSSFSVDTTTKASIVAFDFRYKEAYREKTTKVDIYRSKDPNFEITGEGKFPFAETNLSNEEIESLGEDYTFVKSVFGASDESVGENIERVVDIPPLDIDQDPNSNTFGLSMPTSYFYKLLPYDEFGSGVLFNTLSNSKIQTIESDQINVYPKRFHSSDPSLPPGEIVRPDPENPPADDPQQGENGEWSSVPGPVANLRGDTAFENYFLEWDIFGANKVDGQSNLFKKHLNSINHYELWISNDQNESTLKITDTITNENINLSAHDNRFGHRVLDGNGIFNHFGEKPIEKIDIGEKIENAKMVLEISANSSSLEAVYKGDTNDRRYFWVRSVDFAGNKSPFTGVNMPDEYFTPSLENTNPGVSGLALTLGQLKALDIADFEQVLSKKFPDTISLIPNNPFLNNTKVSVNQSPQSGSEELIFSTESGSIAWDNHIVYKNNVGYYVDKSSTSDTFVYWNTPEEYVLTEENIGAKKYSIGDVVIYEDDLYVCLVNQEYYIKPDDASEGDLNWQKLSDEEGYESYGIKELSFLELAQRNLTNLPGGGSLDDDINNPLRSVKYLIKYKTSNHHPAGEGEDLSLGENGEEGVSSTSVDGKKPKLIKDNHIIVARNLNGVVTPMWHTFANAVIGSAHIQDAAVTNAKIHNLTADKIRSAEIRGQDIQVGGDGQIRSFDFGGLDSMVYDTNNNPIHQQQGFAVSGDGSFVFQNKDGKLFFDGEALTLFGKLKQYDGSEFTFVDLIAEPSSFFYVEQSDGTYIPANRNQYCSLVASFQNSYISSDEVLFEIRNPQGRAFFTYDEFKNSKDADGVYRISGFEYNPDDFDVGVIDPKGPGTAKVAPAKLSVGGFEDMIRYDNDNSASILPQDNSVVIFVSGVNSSMQRSISIDFVADGSSAVYVDLNTESQIFNYDFDGDWSHETNNSDRLELNAQAYNTFGDVRSDFYTGVNLRPENLVKLGPPVFDDDVVRLGSLVDGQTYEIAKNISIKKNTKEGAPDVQVNEVPDTFDYALIGAQDSEVGTKFVFEEELRSNTIGFEDTSVLVHYNDSWTVDLFENGGKAVVDPLSEQVPKVSMTPFVAKVSVVHENVNLDGLGEKDLLLATDFITVYGQQPGKDSYTVVLDNENHTYPCDEYGRVSTGELSEGKTSVVFKRGHDLFNFVPWDPDNHSDLNWNYYMFKKDVDGNIIYDENGNEIIENSTYTIKDPSGEMGINADFKNDVIKNEDHESLIDFKVKKVARDHPLNALSGISAGDIIWDSSWVNNQVTEEIKNKIGDAVIELTYISDSREDGAPFFEESFLKIPIADCKYIRNSVSDEFPPTVFEKNYTFGKSPQGKKGRKVDLILSPQTVKYDTIGLNPDFDKVRAEVGVHNFHNSNPQFKYFIKGEQVKPESESDRTTDNWFEYVVPDSVDDSAFPVTIVVEAYDSQQQDNPSVEEWVKVASDQATIVPLSRASNSKQVVQTQESSIVPVEYLENNVEKGDFTNTKNEILVFEGVDSFAWVSPSALTDYDLTGEGINNKSFTVKKEHSGNIIVNLLDENKAEWIVGSWGGGDPNVLSGDITSERITYTVFTKDSDGQLNEYKVYQNIALSKPSIPNRSISLTATPFAINYSSLDNSKTTSGDVEITTQIRNAASLKFLKFSSTDGGMKYMNEAGEKVDFPETEMWLDPSVRVFFDPPSYYSGKNILTSITCQFSEDSSNTKNVLAEDQINIFCLKSGSDSVSSILSNETHSIPWDTNNVPDVTSSGSSLYVFYGATRLAPKDVTSDAELSDGEYRIDNIDIEGGVSWDKEGLVFKSDYIGVPDIDGFSSSFLTGSRTFSIRIKKTDGDSEKFLSLSVTQNFSLAASAKPIRQVILGAGKQAFSYDGQDKSLSPVGQTCDLTTSVLNVFNPDNRLRYRFSLNGDGSLKDGSETYQSGTWSTSSSLTYVPPGTFGEGRIGTVRCDIAEKVDPLDSDILASDQITLYGIKSGSNAVTIIMGNESHGLAWNAYPTSDTEISGSSTTIEVFHGSQKLSCVDYNSSNLYSGEKGTFSINPTIPAEFSALIEQVDDLVDISDPKKPIVNDLKKYSNTLGSAYRKLDFYIKKFDGDEYQVSKSQSFHLASTAIPIRSASLSAVPIAIPYNKVTYELVDPNQKSLVSIQSASLDPGKIIKYSFSLAGGSLGALFEKNTNNLINENQKYAFSEIEYVPKDRYQNQTVIATIICKVYECDDLTEKEVAQDQISIYGLADGTDSITPILSNQFHGMPWDLKNDDPNYVGTSTDISVYQGATQLQAVEKPIGSSEISNGQFYINSIDSENITAGSRAISNLSISVADASGFNFGDNGEVGTHGLNRVALIKFNLKIKPFSFVEGDALQDISISQSLSINEKGRKGSFTSYRGRWSAQGIYSAADYDDNYNPDGVDRADIIEHGGQYYVAVRDSGPKNEWDSNDWLPFGAEFSNVATSLLLTDSSVVKNEIILGEAGDDNAFIATRPDSNDTVFFKAGIVGGKNYFSLGDGFKSGEDTLDIKYAKIESATSITCLGDIQAFSSSDRRLKTNISLIENALEKIKKIDGVEFDWKEGKTLYKGHDIGLLAQQVNKYFPEIVTERPDGFLAIRYEKFVPVLLSAINEQQGLIKSLNKRLSILEKKIKN